MHPWGSMHWTSDAVRPRDPAAIAAFEHTLGRVLPPDYRRFLEEVNGGRPTSPAAGEEGCYAVVAVDWAGRPPAESSEKAIVRFLLVAADWVNDAGQGKNPALTLGWMYETYVVEQKRLPPGLVPIGRDPGSSLFLLDVGGPEPGSVWFWDGGWFDRDVMPADPYHNVARLAADFSAFIEAIVFIG
jgi:SMI1 / KNR4 family.